MAYRPKIRGSTETAFDIGHGKVDLDTTAVSTPYTFKFPATAGADNQVLTTDGSGNLSWATPSGGGSVYWKDAVRVATTANVTLSTGFENGDVIDGVTLATGDRILIKNQSSAAENGIYTVNASGAPTRATDADTDAEVLRGIETYVQLGTVNGGSRWQLVSSNATSIVVGTSTQVWGPVQGIMGRGINGWTAPTVTGAHAIAIGNGANASSNGSSGVAIGVSSFADGSSVAIGSSANANTNSSAVAIGASASTSSSSASVAIGSGATCQSSASNSVAIGNAASSGNNASSGSVSIGDSTTSAGGIAIGSSATAGANSFTNNETIAIGRSAASTGSNPYIATGCIAIGSSATASTGASRSITGAIAIGKGSSVSAWNAIALGHNARTDFNGQFSLGLGSFASAGDAYIASAMAYQTTTNATATEVGLMGTSATTTPSTYITLVNDTSYIFDCDIVARNTDNANTDTAAWNLKFVIKRGAAAANTAIVGTPTKTVLAQDAGATTWDVAVSADTTNGRPKIDVTGEASKTIRWVCNVRMTKVTG